MVEHIAMVTTSYPLKDAEGEAAAGTFVADFALELSRHVRVSVVAPAPRGATVVQGNLTVHYFPVPRLPLSLLSPRRPDHWPGIITTLRNGRRAVLALCGEQRVDHLLALWALPSGDWARAASRRHGIPYSTWALGSDIWSLGRIPGVRGRLIRVLEDAQRRYANSYHLAGQVQTLVDGDCGLLFSTRQLPVTGTRRIATEPPYRLAFLGRWHPNKGIDLLMEALERLDDPTWARIDAVRIHGGGPLEAQVKAGVAALARAGRPVSMGGYLDRHAAGELLEWADYLVIPSRVESMPVVSSDALQAGCALICTPVGDLPVLLERYRVGLCATRVDVVALVEVLEKALGQSPDRFTVGIHEARQSVTLDSTARQLLADLAR